VTKAVAMIVTKSEPPNRRSVLEGLSNSLGRRRYATEMQFRLIATGEYRLHDDC
jgi:hypothetical protein